MADVVMPQMGESVAEGTIVRWLKKVGDKVERDEPLFEISTDKVDAEVPSPAAGVITEIRHKEGETVDINTVVAVVGTGDGVAAAAGATAPAAAAPKAETQRVESPKALTQDDDTLGSIPPSRPVVTKPVAHAAPAAPAGHPDEDRQRTSPLVRRIAKEHGIDLSRLTGTGLGGRVTKDDILAFIERGASAPARPASSGSAAAARPASAPVIAPGVSAGVGLAGQTVPMSVMRKKIAEHMVLSRKTSAHVHTVFEVSFAQLEKIRQAKKAEYERRDAKLTYLSFILKATVDALRAFPIINASLDGDNVVYHKSVNVGIAVALDWGLIVPVIKNADHKSLLEISQHVVDLANRARDKKLKPDDVADGTFTVTNPGGFGAQFGTPIINQPQVAILAVGAIEKRPVVIDDAIAIRHMAYLCLGFDHRVIDGAVADQFMATIKERLETWDPKDA
jgi:2-oxoglutarate dehydrogenase E2 component (dihydrolipoamide succinyltransferase)